MLGIDDPIVLLVYLLCIGSTLLCVVYGIIYWNTDQDEIADSESKPTQHPSQTGGR